MSLVRPQVTSLAEGLPTDLTAVRLLPGVDPQVQLKAVGVVELLLTEAAWERPVLGVGASMRDEAALLAEALAAVLALERPLARVYAPVDL